MKAFAILCFLLASGVARSQDIRIAGTTDHKAMNIPERYTFSTDSMATYIRDNFKTEQDKLRAIYIWTASHIKYSTDSIYSMALVTDEPAKINAALQRRKGVCENFAAIFKDIAVKSGINSVIINGYTRQAGRVDRTGHSWCAVSIGDEWFLCAPTWDKDAGFNTKYFLVSPQEFITSHMPFDPMWQLLKHPVSHKEFYAGSSPSQKGNEFHYKDSVKAWMQMNELQKIQSSAWRVQQAGIVNEMISNDVAVAKMNLEMIKEDKDTELYNDALNELNKATGILNEFIRYRNEKFMPVKPLNELSNLLDPGKALINAANKKLEEIDRSTAMIKPDTEFLKDKLTNLSAKVADQERFLQKYVAAGEKQRLAMFYQ